MAQRCATKKTMAGCGQRRNNQPMMGAIKVGGSSSRDYLGVAVDDWQAAAEQQLLLLLLLRRRRRRQQQCHFHFLCHNLSIFLLCFFVLDFNSIALTLFIVIMN